MGEGGEVGEEEEEKEEEEEQKEEEEEVWIKVIRTRVFLKAATEDKSIYLTSSLSDFRSFPLPLTLPYLCLKR